MGSLSPVLLVYAVVYLALAEYLRAEAAFAGSFLRVVELEDILLDRRQKRNLPKKRSPRPSWASVEDSINDCHFRRMFRMPKETFHKLCNKIETKVGEDVFKSDQHLLSSRKRKRTHAATTALGGLVGGEVKVAVTIRLLAGGSYLDIFLGYGTGIATNYAAFHDFF